MGKRSFSKVLKLVFPETQGRIQQQFNKPETWHSLMRVLLDE
jgi:hypothetical protein